jgi:hypothetical protein
MMPKGARTRAFLGELDRLAHKRSMMLDRGMERPKLLPGEDPATTYPAEASDWADTYEELCRFTAQVLEITRFDPVGTHNPPNMQFLELEQERLQAHWKFWADRKREVG